MVGGGGVMFVVDDPLTGMDVDQLVALIGERKWVPLAAIVIGFATRLIKDDTKIPINIPADARIWFVLGLGVVSGVLEKVIEGTTWTAALVGGAISVAIAVLTHETLIASIRKGKEIPVPGLMIPGASPSPHAPATVPPVVMSEPPPVALDEDTPIPSTDPKPPVIP